MRFAFTSFAISGLALALAACGQSEEAENANPAEAALDPTAQLSPIQRGSFERLNRPEVQTAFAGLWEELAEGDAAELPTRDDMDFAWLDRDGDGKLSVAEFALWEVPIAPSGAAPALTDQQLTKTASLFFLNDIDGDTLLSEQEFAAASGRPAPAEEDDSDEA